MCKILATIWFTGLLGLFIRANLSDPEGAALFATPLAILFWVIIMIFIWSED